MALSKLYESFIKIYAKRLIPIYGCQREFLTLKNSKKEVVVDFFYLPLQHEQVENNFPPGKQSLKKFPQGLFRVRCICRPTKILNHVNTSL